MNTEELVDEILDVFDTNHDGLISRGEFIALTESLLNEKGVHFSSDLFNKFDKDHDNKMSRDELIEMIEDLAL